MQMKCLYCDENYIKNSSLIHYLFKKDPLCEKCRSKMIYRPRDINVKDIKVRAFYEYNPFISSLILQYKECHDEALKDIFFYDLIDQIRLKYYGYTIIWVPSTKYNKNKRGFDHMMEMLKCLKMNMLDALYKVNEKSQNNLSKIKREEMMDNIKLKDNIKVPDKVLLVDDIITTGSSIYGAYKALKDKCQDIKIIALVYVI